jgi:HK97 family phage major capsid protein/HK97 family phage prohead protease
MPDGSTLRAGASAPDVVLKATAAPSPSGDPLEFVMSDETVDRYGDVIVASGWQLASFRKNPIALFGHSSNFVIGNWRDVRIEGSKLLGRLDLMPAVSERLTEIHAAVRAGVLRAVSVGFRAVAAEPIDQNDKFGPARFLKSELLECSLVAVPANPNAVQLAKELNLSPETRNLIFGEPAVLDRIVRRSGDNPGKTAVYSSRTKRKTGMSGISLSQRIEEKQNVLNVSRDRLAELTGEDDLDIDAVEDLTSQIDTHERALAALKASEAKIGLAAVTGTGSTEATGGTARRSFAMPRREVKGFDLIVRAVTARGLAHFGGRPLERVLEERYPGDEATAYIAKADQTIGTTTVSGWASELVPTVQGDFMQALSGFSIYPALRGGGIGLSFDGAGTVSIPSRTAGGAGGGFVAEGAPIRVGRITTAATTMTPKKMGVIIPFSREVAKRSTPAIEGLVRQAILEDTAVILDAALLDNVAASTARPAGLLNGVTAVANGYGGGDFQAVMADFGALLAPFYAANAANGITVLMNPAQALKLAMMPGPGDGRFGWFSDVRNRLTILESTHVPANRLIALRNTDFATALGDAPEFDISEQATVHMEDTTPLEIVSGTGPTTADPVRSFFQTATIGVRMMMDVSWAMRRSGMVQWIDTTSW